MLYHRISKYFPSARALHRHVSEVLPTHTKHRWNQRTRKGKLNPHVRLFLASAAREEVKESCELILPQTDEHGSDIFSLSRRNHKPAGHGATEGEKRWHRKTPERAWGEERESSSLPRGALFRYFGEQRGEVTLPGRQKVAVGAAKGSAPPAPRPAARTSAPTEPPGELGGGQRGQPQDNGDPSGVTSGARSRPRSPQRRHETGSWVNGLCK